MADLTMLKKLVEGNSIYVCIVDVLDIRQDIANLEKEVLLANSILRPQHCHPLLSLCLMLCPSIHPLNL